MKNATATTKPVPATSNQPEVLPIQTKHLAVKFGMKATALRRVLRSMSEYADGVHTNYRWAENDPRIKSIEDKIKQLKSDKQARAAAAKAALDARIAATQVQAKADAQLA